MAIITALAILSALPFGAQAATYYADCSSSCPGKGTQSDPWCSIAEVNAPTFQPGDVIGFKAGTKCIGTLAPKGVGTSSKIIQLTSYGSGASPIINGTGAAAAALTLTNQDYWKISKMHVTSPAAAVAMRRGIFIDANDGKTHTGITIDSNLVDYVAGQTNKGSHSSDFSSSAGIVVGAENGSRYDNVLVTGNNVTNCGGGGIKVRVGSMTNRGQNVRVTNSNVQSCGGDGIIISYAESPSIDHNVASDLGKGAYPFAGGNFAGMWVLGNHNPVISYNVVYGSTMSSFDSEAFDCDWGNSGNCTVEYNYSRNNAGGAFLNCDGCGTSGGADQVVRYNIFENDCRIISSGNTPKLYFYQNVMYCPDKAFSLSLNPTSYVTNNIFVGNGNSTLPNKAGTTWEWNVFYNVDRPTSNGIEADPEFSNPGTDGTTLSGGNGYKLKSNSPALANGAVIANNGGKDFFGNTVSNTAKPNRGAYNGPGV